MNVLMVIAPENFRDEELFHTKEELEKAGANVTVASRGMDTCTGMLGGTATPDISLREVNADDYDAVIFVGGRGSEVYFNNPVAVQLARDAYAAGKVVAAICIAPSILANAGLLRGKKATAFLSQQNNLIAKGADFTDESVIVDGKIITADGPGSAREFGKTIARTLQA